MAVVLALAAAFLFALGVVLQQRVATEASPEEAASAGFMLRLARKPVWLAGVVADAAGFACQAIALGAGRLVVVQPLLASSMVFALPLAAKINGRKVSRRELAAAIAVSVGLAAFLVFSNPSKGVDDARPVQWLASCAVIGVVCIVLVVAARGRGPAGRAMLYGAASGILYGLTAALTKATVDRFGDGLGAVLLDWHVYALIVAGYLGTSLAQSSLQSGALGAALASQAAMNPVASLALGIVILDERLHETTLGVVITVIALIAVLAGLYVLAVGQAADAAEPAAPAPPAAAVGSSD